MARSWHKSWCDNSLYFAKTCEVPACIDPKFSNPSGKELPIFPVKDEIDYKNFLVWKNSQKDDTQKLDEDKLFLRYRCEANFLAMEDPMILHQSKKLNTKLASMRSWTFWSSTASAATCSSWPTS